MYQQIIHMSILFAAVFITGCTLNAPGDFGASCDNIHLEDILPACENDDISCLESYQDAVGIYAL